ncbi:MAG: mechanosensitive ion channel [Saprospiraceae bacterium]|nr:mechanosensitive ion channel [Saprospiraceae bacterium]
MLLLLALAIYWRFFYDIEVSTGKLRILNTLLSVFIMLLLFRIIIDLIALWYKIDRKHGSGRLRDNLIVGLSNLFSIFSGIAISLGMLSVFGLNPTEVFTSLSIVAAALAIISKDFIAEIIVGLFNGFSTKIELDDYIKVGDQKGKIIDIGLQKVTLMNDDDDIIYIPNLRFYYADIINYTKRDIRRMNVEFHVDPRYLEKLSMLEKSLSDTLKEFEDFLDMDTHELKVVNIQRESVELKFQYTLKSVSRDIQRQIRKKIMKKVLESITDNKPVV